MFLPLREIIRLRIATMVGRSKAELETRRKRLDALKKQALSDYAEELAGGGRSSSSKQKSARSTTEAAAEEEEDEELAFERSLIAERNAAEKLSAGADAEKGAEDGDEEEEDLDLQEEEDGDNENSSAGRSRATYDEDEDMDDDEEDDEQEQEQADKQQNGQAKVTFAESEPDNRASEFSF
ncbi:RNA polymerase III transcription factor (TF)IIIC subunit [Phytophthora cinnamomi]|nr:RNA polymerase III transcription factor (TF)IIIC subunit [Phytophthora cinnamomi]